MIILGHKDIEYKPFFLINNIKDISNTPSNSTVIFKFSTKLSKYCLENDVKSAVIVHDIKEIVFTSALGASFIVCEKKLVKKAQKLADEYMFDAKILLLSDDEEQMIWAAKKFIDGVLFHSGIHLKDAQS